MNNNLVVLELDRPRTLKYGNKALKIIEKTFGCDIVDFKFDKLSIDKVTKLIHIGLIHEDPTLTIEQTEDLLDNYATFVEQLKAFSMAFKASIGVDDEIIPNFQGVQETPDKPKNGTGKNLKKMR